jgi:hypothetical protein
MFLLVAPIFSGCSLGHKKVKKGFMWAVKGVQTLPVDRVQYLDGFGEQICRRPEN